MFLLDLLHRFVDYVNEESNEEVEKFIDSTYFYQLRISGLYPFFTGKYVFLTSVQISFFLAVLMFHIYLLTINSLYFLDVSLVLFSQEVHFLIIMVTSFFFITTNVSSRSDFARIHRHMMSEFYDYNEGESKVMEELKMDTIKEKLRLMMVPLAATVNGSVVIFVSRYLDNTYGDFDMNKYDINFMLPFPCKNIQAIDSSQGFGYLLLVGAQLTCLTVALPLVYTGAGFILVCVLLDFIRQLRFLRHKIETAEKRAAVLYLKNYGYKPTEIGDQLYSNENFQKCFQTCINRCVEHHAVLMSVFENITGFMGFNFFQSFLAGSLMIALGANCVNIDSELPGTTLANLALCINEIAFMYLLSSFGQRISDLSDEIRMEFYNLKWYLCTPEFRKGITVIQEGCLRTMTIMGAKIVPVNLNTFSNVMNSAYTYYNLLNALSE